MNVTLLRRVYQQQGIKKKALKWIKRPKPNMLKKYGKLKEELHEEIYSVRAAGFEILYLDECMFT